MWLSSIHFNVVFNLLKYMDCSLQGGVLFSMLYMSLIVSATVFFVVFFLKKVILFCIQVFVFVTKHAQRICIWLSK